MTDTVTTLRIDQSGLLQRHQLVWITATAWQNWIQSRTELTHIDVVANWAKHGRPFIARTSTFPEWQQRLTLGLPLPPSLGRHRLSIDVPKACFLRSGPPPLLSEAIGTAPISWRAPLQALATRHAEVRCFGSVAWQYLSGLDYLTAASDVDLLWSVNSASDADAVVEAIARVAEDVPMRLDGELITPLGTAVQWSEWYTGASKVLVKSRTGVSMRERGEVFQ